MLKHSHNTWIPSHGAWPLVLLWIHDFGDIYQRFGAFSLLSYAVGDANNTLFCRQSFTMHLLQLMTSWAVVCDVWYLEPQNIRPGESPIEFAER